MDGKRSHNTGAATKYCINFEHIDGFSSQACGNAMCQSFF
jgi:hypothetical protein